MTSTETQLPSLTEIWNPNLLFYLRTDTICASVFSPNLVILQMKTKNCCTFAASRPTPCPTNRFRINHLGMKETNSILSWKFHFLALPPLAENYRYRCISAELPSGIIHWRRSSLTRERCIIVRILWTHFQLNLNHVSSEYWIDGDEMGEGETSVSMAETRQG